MQERTRHRFSATLSVALLLVAASPMCHGQVYRCIEKDGTRTYSDVPCAYDANAPTGSQNATTSSAVPGQSASKRAPAPAEPAALPTEPTTLAPARGDNQSPITPPSKSAYVLFNLMAPIVLALIAIGGIWLITLILRTRSDANGLTEESTSIDTATPSVFAFSMSGRIGRLRYLAFSWAMALPMLVILGLALLSGRLSAASRGGVGTPPMLLFFLILIPYVWTSTRVMVLRLHDFNRSGKWVLAVFIASFVVGAFGGMNSLNGMLVRTSIWIGALALMLWPGTRGENAYGAPAGANSFWVFVGAAIFPVTLVFVAIRAIKLPH